MTEEGEEGGGAPAALLRSEELEERLAGGLTAPAGHHPAGDRPTGRRRRGRLGGFLTGDLPVVCRQQGARSRVVEVTLAREDGAPRQARERLKEELGRTDAPAVLDVVLLVDELVTNSVLHGAGDTVTVLAIADSDCVRVEVWDGGRGFLVPRPPRIPPTAKITGRGLYIVDRLASRWGLQRADGGVCVWFEIER